MSMLGSLLAGGGAQAAASEAEEAAEHAEDAATPSPSPRETASAMQSDAPPYEVPETFREGGQL